MQMSSVAKATDEIIVELAEEADHAITAKHPKPTFSSSAYTDRSPQRPGSFKRNVVYFGGGQKNNHSLLASSSNCNAAGKRRGSTPNGGGGSQRLPDDNNDHHVKAGDCAAATKSVNVSSSSGRRASAAASSTKSGVGVGCGGKRPTICSAGQSTIGQTALGNASSPISGFGDLLEWLRPRAFSDNAKGRRRSSGGDTGVFSMASSDGDRRTSTATTSSVGGNARTASGAANDPRGSVGRRSGQDEGIGSFDLDEERQLVDQPLYVDTRMANAWVNSIPQPYAYRRSMSISSDPFVLGGNRLATSALGRQRRNSEFGRYLIMRRSRDPEGTNEFVGHLEDTGEQVYSQLLSTMKCYDLMPQMSKNIVLDSSLSIHKAFLALIRNWVSAALVIEATTCTVLGLLTITDLLNLLLEINSTNTAANTTTGSSSSSTSNTGTEDTVGSQETILNLPLHTGLSYEKTFSKRPAPVAVYSDSNLYSVAKLLCEQRLHRVIVYDSEINSDPVFLLSKKMILKALHAYISRLPLPRCMHLSLEELRLGTWSNLFSVTLNATVHDALLLFTKKHVSALPVLNDVQSVVDVLTKADIMNMVAEESDHDAIPRRNVQQSLSFRPEGAKKLVMCHKKITLMLAIESVIQANSSRYSSWTTPAV